MEKPEFLNGLRQEYQGWQELLEQIGPENMNKPDVAGDWSIKDIVAHLTGWRKRTVARLQAAQRGETGTPPPWDPKLSTDDEINAWIYEANRGHSVQEVLDESDQVFQQVLMAVEGLPDEVLQEPQRYLPWLEGNPFTPAALFAHYHDEHEADMRAWLARIER
jgi:hypothetical protein